MRNISILAGAAALAIAGPALAQGKGNGGGGPKGGGGVPAKVERGGGGGGNGGGPKMQRGGGGGGGQQVQRGNGGGGGQKAMRGGGQQRAERQQMRGPERQQVRGPSRRDVADARPQKAQKMQKADRRPIREARDNGPRGKAGREIQQREIRGNGGDRTVLRDVRVADRNSFRTVQVDRNRDYYNSPAFRTTGLVDGCPPGLAAKNNGCLPPGQAKKYVGAAVPAFLGTALLPPLYQSWYPDNDDYYYRTYDDYVYRIDRDRNYVDGFFPMYNDYSGSYYVGAAYPQDYLGYYNVPAQYQPWYADNNDYYYRYGDGAIYQVDRQGGVIESIVSLLAGDFGVGQPLPTGYDVYNVPYDYRDQYADTQDNWYRYNDGNIYEVDPTTRIVQAIVETLV
ncbi:hypothetical protein GCM10022280_02200 [Sphingomonas swuensis]|uniref:RcnB family protein n=1 Tax=Sphingomonas swuensis TaxID=977800 RepID=A0ABP7SAL6_9SPHN